jgi:hypothetical protein
LTRLSATAVSLRSAAYSASRVCCSTAAQSCRPSCFAKATSVPQRVISSCSTAGAEEMIAASSTLLSLARPRMPATASPVVPFTGCAPAANHISATKMPSAFRRGGLNFRHLTLDEGKCEDA